MQIKVDEDLPVLVVSLLRDRGYLADSVVGQGMMGWKDAEIWRKIQAENRFLITADKGFADLRLDQDGIRPTIELLEKVLQNYDLTGLEGTITVVSTRGVRVPRKI